MNQLNTKLTEDIPRISLYARDIYDSLEMAFFIRDHPKKPLIAVAMGPKGQLSQTLAPISFVTHDLHPYSTPGQLSLADLHKSLHLLGQLPARRFYIFGNNISHSMSPTLHNAAFQELGLPHFYQIYETENVDTNVRNLMAMPNFGGASVTFPHKLQIGVLLARISRSARLIGAVNTVIVEESTKGRILVGDNTDWLGIRSCITNNWGGNPNKTTSLVIGAGGAARAAVFALQQLGINKISLVNRTFSTSERLASDFPDLEMTHFKTLGEVVFQGPLPQVIVACVPADDMTENDIPRRLFARSNSCVLVEMAYRPRVTALMKVARSFDNWKVLQGTDVLKEQAYHQFSLWTGRRAPVSVMIEALERESH
jgi:shikimate-5-dehydrogenase